MKTQSEFLAHVESLIADAQETGFACHWWRLIIDTDGDLSFWPLRRDQAMPITPELAWEAYTAEHA